MLQVIPGEGPEVEIEEASFNLYDSLLERFPYLQEVNYRLITSKAELAEYLEGLKPGQPLVLDLETEGLNPQKHNIVGVALTYAEKEGVYVPVAHTVKPELNVAWEDVRDLLNAVFADRHAILPFNWKFEGNFLEVNGVTVSEWLDCMVSAYLDDPNFPASLKKQTHRLYGVKQVDFGDCFPDVKKKDWNFANVDPEIAYLYACGDVDWTQRIWNDTEEARVEQKFIFGVENTLTDVVRRMENNGVCLDLVFYRLLEKELIERIEVVRERVYRLTGRTVNKIKKKTRVKRDPETNKPIKDPQTGKSIKETVEEVETVEFSLDSQPQVAKKLFGTAEEGGLEIPNPHRTGAGKVATSEAVMDKMRDEHPVIADILHYRKLVKCLNTYIRNLINGAEPVEGSEELGIGKFSFLQCRAPTGRFASSKGGTDSGYVQMNVQSVPAAVPSIKEAWEITEWKTDELKETPCLYSEATEYLNPDCARICTRSTCACIDQGKAEGVFRQRTDEEDNRIKYWEIPNVRKGFRGRPGFKMVAIDYSGIELRIAANLSREPVWLAEFAKPDPDLHLASAKAIYKRDNITKQERGNAKTVNFASLYGGSGAAIARQIEGMSVEEGKKVVANFFSGLPGLKAWIKGMHKEGQRNHVVRTWFRRRRPLHMYKDNDPKTRGKSIAFGDRSTVSTAVQGTAADVMKIALVRLDKTIKANGWQDDCRMLLTIHDECVFEVRETKLLEIVPKLVEAMAFPVKEWPVPLICDVEIGDNWGEGKEHRLHNGELILHSELSAAIKEGREAVPVPTGLRKQVVEDEKPLPTGPAPDPNQRVTLVFKSLLTRTNLTKLRELIVECSGPTPIVMILAGQKSRYGINETVDVVQLIRRASEEGLSLSIET